MAFLLYLTNKNLVFYYVSAIYTTHYTPHILEFFLSIV